MAFISPGEFEMGSSSLEEDVKPVHSVFLDGFFIDKYEVTVEKYKKCVLAGVCDVANTNFWDDIHQLNFDEHCNYDLDTIGDRSHHPINCVDWDNAKKYCQFVKKRLPTEAEWEKAATWKNGKKVIYPSGKTTITCEDAVMMVEDDIGCGKVRTWEVGSKPIEINGTYDMAGNVWEWVADRFSDYSAENQINPQGASFGDPVIRGGGWDSIPSQLRGTYRHYFDENNRGYELGFRCAASP